MQFAGRRNLDKAGKHFRRKWPGNGQSSGTCFETWLLTLHTDLCQLSEVSHCFWPQEEPRGELWLMAWECCHPWVTGRVWRVRGEGEAHTAAPG